MFKGLVQKIGLRLASFGVARQDSRGASVALRSSARQQRFVEHIQSLLREAQSRQPGVLAGTVEMLGLGQIRQDLGAAWPSVAARAHTIAETVIRRHLTVGDAFRRHDEETYVLCFAGLDAAEANHKVSRIVSEIADALTREVPEARTVRVNPFVATVDRDRIGGSDGVLFDTLAVSLAAIKQEAVAAAQERRHSLLRDARLLVCGIAEEASAGRLLDLVPRLRRFSRSVVMAISPADNRMNDFSGGGILGVSSELAALSLTSDVTFRHFAKQVTAAKAARLHVFAHGANTLGVAKTAIAAGVDFLDGEAIAARSELPRSAFRLNPIPT